MKKTIFIPILFLIILNMSLLNCSDDGSDSDTQMPPGSLDTSFGNGGIVTTPIGTGDDSTYAIAIQSDGKIVVAGFANLSSNNDFALARYNYDGSLDTNFGTGGKVTTNFSSNADFGQAIAIDTYGRIVVAGYCNSSDLDFALARYYSNGSLDSSFGTNGIVKTNFGSGGDTARAVVIDAYGRIVAAGDAFMGSNNDFAFARYYSNGSLDIGFGNNGKLTTTIGSGHDSARAIAIDSNGRIVVAGYANNGTNYDFALARYYSNGSLDSTFGNGGKIMTPIGSSDDYAYAIAIDSYDRIVVAGYAKIGSYSDFALARYYPDGGLDTSFGTDGKVTTPIGSSDDTAYAIGIDANGRIVVAGYVYNGSNYDFALARYNPDGTLDTTFGNGGIVTTDFGVGDDQAFCLAIDANGKIVVAGKARNGSNMDFALARYNP
ncbi:MAG: delta-60 repeat domain-containing protein [Spirochaetota bacterium]